MEYVIECRFSDAFSSSPPIRELMPNAQQAVLFSYAFSDDETIDASEVTQAVETAVSDLRYVFAPPLDWTLDSIKSEQGSIIITLLALSVVAPAAPVVVPVAGAGFLAGGITLWAADHFLGGALSKAGETLAQTVISRLPWNHPRGADTVRNPQLIADQQAAEVAMVRGCQVVPMAGGIEVNINDHDIGYKYVYQLVGARPGLLSVVVDRYARHPVEYHVFETISEQAHVAQGQPAPVLGSAGSAGSRRSRAKRMTI